MLKIFKMDFKIYNFLPPIVINIIFSFLMYLFYYKGFASDFVNHDLLQNQYFMFSNIIVVMMILLGILKAMSGYDKILNDESLFISYKTAGIFENCIFWGKTLSLWLQLVINFSITLVILLMFSGLSIPGLTILYYLLFLLLSSLLIVTLAALIRFFIKGSRNIEMNISYGLILLLLCSGFFMPFSLLSGPVYYIIKYLPFSMIMEGSSKILTNNAFSLIESLYVTLLTLTLLGTNYILYKKELRK